MQVNISIFGQIKDITNSDNFIIDNVNSTDELINKLHLLYPSLINNKYAIAVNKNIITQNILLKDNDAIALLPPFSGG